MTTHVVHPHVRPTRPIKKASGVRAAVFSGEPAMVPNRRWQAPKAALADYWKAGKHANQPPSPAMGSENHDGPEVTGLKSKTQEYFGNKNAG